MTKKTELPRYILWSTDQINMADPFQRRWALRQILMNGRGEDISQLNLDEVAAELENLDLPAEIYSLWKCFLAAHDRDRVNS